MKNQKYNNAIVFGAGAFGTSIATVLANNFNHVYLFARSEDVFNGINQNHENTVYLPGHRLAGNIKAARTWEELEADLKGPIDLLVNGLPTEAIRSFFKQNKNKVQSILDDKVPMVSLTKGIDPDTLELVDDLLYDFFSPYKDQFTFLSGPSFAKEIVDEQITLVSLAGKSRNHLLDMIKMLETDYFKVLPTYDVRGLLLGGALKNVLAIAGGIIEGLGLNHNTRAALITRGIHEMLRFGIVYNARPETFYGLSGVGDLILTSTGEISRNKLFGLEIAKGRRPEDIIKSQRSVVEGYKTTRAANLLSDKYSIRANIFNGVYEVLYLSEDPKTVIKRLMKVPSRLELDI